MKVDGGVSAGVRMCDRVRVLVHAGAVSEYSVRQWLLQICIQSHA